MKQEQAFEILKAGKNAFITGPAGSGKTFLLNRYIDWLKTSGVEAAVTASTGIAATHLNGITIHSWTGMGVREELGARDIKELVKRGYLRRRFLRARVLIIDEISMLGGYQLDMADRLFREFKQTDAPFGGVQVVFCGDFFQLPPIKRKAKENKTLKKRDPQSSFDFFDDEGESNGSIFAYGSAAWKDLDLKICYLDEQHRQGENDFLRTLNAIRNNQAGDAERHYLETRVGAKIGLLVEPTKLYTHNIDVDVENELELAKIDGKEYRYKMELIGPPALSERLQKSCLAPAVLRLKVGARVMFVKNNFDEGYVNGTLGVVEKLGEERIMVRTSAGLLFDVGPASWHIAEEGDIKAEIAQYPLRLAWAITVHKSQGMSLDAALIDLRQSFEPGMGYVALSRVRSPEGLSLAGFNEMALTVNREVLEFDKKLKDESARHEREIFMPRKLEGDKFSGQGPKAKLKIKKEKKPDTVQATRDLAAKGLALEEIAAARKLKEATIIDHCEKIKALETGFDFSHLAKNMPAGRLIQLKAAVRKCRGEDGNYPLKPVMDLLAGEATYEELRLARLLI